MFIKIEWNSMKGLFAIRIFYDGIFFFFVINLWCNGSEFEMLIFHKNHVYCIPNLEKQFEIPYFLKNLENYG